MSLSRNFKKAAVILTVGLASAFGGYKVTEDAPTTANKVLVTTVFGLFGGAFAVRSTMIAEDIARKKKKSPKVQ